MKKIKYNKKNALIKSIKLKTCKMRTMPCKMRTINNRLDNSLFQNML